MRAHWLPSNSCISMPAAGRSRRSSHESPRAGTPRGLLLALRFRDARRQRVHREVGQRPIDQQRRREPDRISPAPRRTNPLRNARSTMSSRRSWRVPSSFDPRRSPHRSSILVRERARRLRASSASLPARSRMYSPMRFAFSMYCVSRRRIVASAAAIAGFPPKVELRPAANPSSPHAQLSPKAASRRHSLRNASLRLKPSVIAGPPLSRTAHAALHFVANEKNSVLPGKDLLTSLNSTGRADNRLLPESARSQWRQHLSDPRPA